MVECARVPWRRSRHLRSRAWCTAPQAHTERLVRGGSGARHPPVTTRPVKRHPCRKSQYRLIHMRSPRQGSRRAPVSRGGVALQQGRNAQWARRVPLSATHPCLAVAHTYRYPPWYVKVQRPCCTRWMLAVARGPWSRGVHVLCAVFREKRSRPKLWDMV